ncbi:hypothetical protein [Guptibacillus hwajinpoensis]|uniref:hypothetical protein n=1 Tax=Guptibacillus hwajinpoensis TaxID=208199 RepID=UPI001CFD807A|nr:hypothetical protein [Pseudalkalibacillus hwajinpoensis]WLR59219.1 hypothetical protein LC071_19070 [Pseudalkalibacillus hwajinpoensis]
MIETLCFFCKKKFHVKPSDSQFRKLKQNPGASYVCKACNQSMQREAQQSTGIHPDQIDQYDKFFR